MIFEDSLNWLAFGWFVVLWGGYTLYAKIMTSGRFPSRQSLSTTLFAYRVDWMRKMMRHPNRIEDFALVGNLTTMVNFLATTTILVLAGIVTAIIATDGMLDLLSGHTFIPPTNKEEVQFKLLLLGIIFVFAFFKFTWSMRQHTFCNIMMGALPLVKEDEAFTTQHEEMAVQAARISDRAGHEFNFGLRAYYFALAVLTWFLGPLVFMGVTAMVVFVLYRREFTSRTLKYLVWGRQMPADVPQLTVVVEQKAA